MSCIYRIFLSQRRFSEEDSLFEALIHNSIWRWRPNYFPFKIQSRNSPLLLQISASSASKSVSIKMQNSIVWSKNTRWCFGLSCGLPNYCSTSTSTQTDIGRALVGFGDRFSQKKSTNRQGKRRGNWATPSNAHSSVLWGCGANTELCETLGAQCGA